MTKYILSRKPRNLKDDFITSFDTLFDELINGMYPNEKSRLNKDFFLKGSYPKCNVYANQNGLFIDAAIPGLEKNDVKIDIKEGILSISGNSANAKEDKDAEYYYREIKKSSFQRSFKLSENLDKTKVKARVDNGILNISIPFLEPKEEPNKVFAVKID